MGNLTKELINKAFSLSYFIHRDKKLAITIAAESVSKLEVAMLAQDKRLYYKPTGRSTDGQITNTRFRTKVSMNELHLLQRLVYVVSEVYEQEQEKNPLSFYLNQADLTIRFIKHLIKITVKRNSFYLTLGLSRLLYSYTTSETILLYSLIIQDGSRSKDEDYFRARKKQIKQEIQERFGNLLKTIKTKQGEDRFLALESINQYLELTAKCLSQFTPWNSDCILPTKLDPLLETIEAFAFAGKDPDKEHYVEAIRIHSLIHPECYRRLIMSLNFDSPDKKLEIPKFFVPDLEKEKPPNDDEEKLTDQELAKVEALLIEQENQRRNAFGRWLSIRVDNKEELEIDLLKNNKVKLQLSANAEILEIFQKENNLLLTSCLLNLSENPLQHSITLEAGQKISITINLGKDYDELLQNAEVEISYQETEFYRKALLKVKQIINQVNIKITNSTSKFLQPALTFGIVFLIVLAGYFVVYKKEASSPEVVKQNAPKVTPAPTPKLQSQSPIPTPKENYIPNNKPTEKVENEELIASNKHPKPKFIGKIPNEIEKDDWLVTRNAQDAVSIVSLPLVKKIYVDPIDQSSLSKNFRAALIKDLAKKFVIPDNRDDADAVFKGSFNKDNNGNLLISLELINSDGNIIWSIRNTNGITSAKIPNLSTAITKQLLKDIKSLNSSDSK